MKNRSIFLKDVLDQAVEKTKEIMIEKNVVTENIDETAATVGIGAVLFQELFNYRIVTVISVPVFGPVYGLILL